MVKDDLTGTVDDDVILAVVEQPQFHIDILFFFLFRKYFHAFVAANERLLVQV